MPDHDALGRRKDEDPPAGLGWTSAAGSRTPATPSQPEAAIDEEDPTAAAWIPSPPAATASTLQVRRTPLPLAGVVRLLAAAAPPRVPCTCWTATRPARCARCVWRRRGSTSRRG